MDFNAPISNAQTLIEMDVHWPGLPAAFDVTALSGDLRIAIGQGEVLDQQPGFGRVLGLFNLTNLPRRLLLDFRDVLSEGLHFEEMTGDFSLTDGVAQTDNFLIRASAAKIHMQGAVDFVQKSYDQIIVIRPQIGKTFPTLGAIAGGPVGAAAGFLVQGLLGKQLKNANEIKYHVTGPWSEPMIELLEQNNE
jgi:Predicted membrane protein